MTARLRRGQPPPAHQQGSPRCSPGVLLVAPRQEPAHHRRPALLAQHHRPEADQPLRPPPLRPPHRPNTGRSVSQPATPARDRNGRLRHPGRRLGPAAAPAHQALAQRHPLPDVVKLTPLPPARVGGPSALPVPDHHNARERGVGVAEMDPRRGVPSPTC